MEQEGLWRREKGWKHNGNTARNADTRIRRRFVEATKKKKKNEAGYGVKREEKVETRKGGGWKKRSGSGGGERKVLCLCSVYTGQAKEKAGKNGIRNVQPEVDTVSAPWTPVSRNCWINNCRTEQKNRKHGNSVIYCASSVRYCENSETFVCEGEKM